MIKNNWFYISKRSECEKLHIIQNIQLAVKFSIYVIKYVSLVICTEK